MALVKLAPFEGDGRHLRAALHIQWSQRGLQDKRKRNKPKLNHSGIECFRGGFA